MSIKKDFYIITNLKGQYLGNNGRFCKNLDNIKIFSLKEIEDAYRFIPRGGNVHKNGKSIRMQQGFPIRVYLCVNEEDFNEIQYVGSGRLKDILEEKKYDIDTEINKEQKKMQKN